MNKVKLFCLTCLFPFCFAMVENQSAHAGISKFENDSESEKRALLIGDKDAGIVTDIDLARMESFLMANGYEISILTDWTESGLRSSIPDGTTSFMHFLFYYSGHIKFENGVPLLVNMRGSEQDAAYDSLSVKSVELLLAEVKTMSMLIVYDGNGVFGLCAPSYVLARNTSNLHMLCAPEDATSHPLTGGNYTTKILEGLSGWADNNADRQVSVYELAHLSKRGDDQEVFPSAFLSGQDFNLTTIEHQAGDKNE